MKSLRFLLAPLALLLLPGAAPPGTPAPLHGVDGDMAEPLAAALPAPRPQPEPQAQVRIMQRFSIRISPGAPLPPQVRMEFDSEDDSPRFEERRLGKCLAVGQIGAVQAAPRNRLLLFMRDSRIVSASLEKACRASEFYSGFYIAHNADGQLCLARDVLQSRSGASCKVRRWSELVEVDDRRFP